MAGEEIYMFVDNIIFLDYLTIHNINEYIKILGKNIQKI